MYLIGEIRWKGFIKQQFRRGSESIKTHIFITSFISAILKNSGLNWLQFKVFFCLVCTLSLRNKSQNLNSKLFTTHVGFYNTPTFLKALIRQMLKEPSLILSVLQLSVPIFHNFGKIRRFIRTPFMHPYRTYSGTLIDKGLLK